MKLTQLTTSFSLLFVLMMGKCPEPVVDMKLNQRLCGNRYQVEIDSKQETVESFLGIPYARPPIYDLRFAKPEPFSAWSNTERAAYRHSPSCIQYNSTDIDKKIKALLMWFPKEQSEDCLYLNVYRPKFPFENGRNKLPVMVWIYGGSFSSGTGSLDVYNGEVLAAKQDVIVVTMNYRVGIFGFLYAEKNEGSCAGDKYDLPGNQGLWDQSLALKWVKDNIESFGGDSNRITLFGESAGAASVSLQYMSPYSNFLFNQMIIQSGSAYGRWVLDTKEIAAKKTDHLLKQLSCPSIGSDREGAINCLRKAPSYSLSSPEIFADIISDERNSLILNNPDVGENRRPGLYFDSMTNPVIDGKFVEKPPKEFFANRPNKNYTKNFIIGTNRNEGMFFLLYYFDLFRKNFEKPKIPQSIDEMRKILIHDFLPDTAFPNEITNLIMERYRLNDANLTKDEFITRLDKLGSHLDFTCPTLRFGNEITSKMSPNNVFVYLFDIQTKSLDLPQWVGVMHGYEIEYIFGAPFQKKFQKDFYSFTNEEAEASRRIMEYFGNFARTGDVNKFRDEGRREKLKMPIWPKVTFDNDNYLRLGMKMSPVENFYQNNCYFWDKTLPMVIETLKKYAAYDKRKPNYGMTKVTSAAGQQPLFHLHFLLFLLASLYARQ